MPNYTFIRKLIPLIIVCALLLSGCQVFNLLWPKDSPAEIAEVLPDEAEIEALEEEIEKMEEEVEAVATDVHAKVTVYPLTSSFTMHYNLEAKATAFLSTASETQQVTFVSSGPVDVNRPTYPINKQFYGSEETIVEGSNGGVPCFVKLKSDATYNLFGQFNPKTCQFELTLSGELNDMNIVENTCLEYANQLQNFPTFFIPPPEVIFVISRADEEVFLDQYHSVRLSNINLEYPIADTCPMK